MRTLLRAASALLGFGLLLVGGGMAIFTVADAERPIGSGDFWLTAFFIATALGGLALVQAGMPGVPAQFVRGLGPALRQPLRWLFSVEALLDPVGLAVPLLAAAPFVAAAGRGAAFAYTLSAYIGWCLANVVALVLRPGWWVRALVSLATSPVLMFSLIGIAEAAQPRSVGEAALALVGPLMMHWAGVALSGLVQFAVSRRASRASGSEQA